MYQWPEPEKQEEIFSRDLYPLGRMQGPQTCRRSKRAKTMACLFRRDSCAGQLNPECSVCGAQSSSAPNAGVFTSRGRYFCPKHDTCSVQGCRDEPYTTYEKTGALCWEHWKEADQVYPKVKRCSAGFCSVFLFNTTPDYCEKHKKLQWPQFACASCQNQLKQSNCRYCATCNTRLACILCVKRMKKRGSDHCKICIEKLRKKASSN